MDLHEEMHVICLPAELQKLTPPTRKNPVKDGAKVFHHLGRDGFAAVLGHQHDMEPQRKHGVACCLILHGNRIELKIREDQTGSCGMNGYRFRLYPTKEQAETLLRWIGCQRLIYNAKVQEDRYFRRFRARFAACTGMEIPVDQSYSQFKTERTTFLQAVPSQVLRNGAVLWRQAYARHFQGLGGRPKRKRKGGKQSVWLTSELFRFVPVAERETGEITGYRLIVGTNKYPVGEIPYKAHRVHSRPASIHISIQSGHWFVSFAAEDSAVSESDPEVVADHLRSLGEERLLARTLGADRGVAKPLMTSDGRVYDLMPVQKDRIEKHRQQTKKWQRRAARRKKGSKNQQKAYRRAARYKRYDTNVRREYAHQTSHALVANDDYDLYVFEDLKIQNMTRRPRAKKDEKGRWMKNGVKAKAGLNRAILASAWGQVLQFTEYKARRAWKLVVKILPAYSSQECAACAYTHPDNRPSQAEFVCLRCGHQDNADHNASLVVARRGVKKLLSGEPLAKKKKSVRMRKQLGPERSEVTPGETPIRHDAGDPGVAHKSMSQEIPAATPETPAWAR